MANKDKVLEIAAAEIGYLEKGSNAQLDEKTANAGSANWTKYGRDMCKITPVYGTHSAWCDCFVDWCFVQAYGKEEAKTLLGDFSAYTPTSASYFQARKQWYTSPQAGDIIFFKNTQRICHTGIVVKVDSQYVYTIEGNTSSGNQVVPNGGGVHAKAYKLNNSAIAGYGRPLYTEEDVISFISKNPNHFYGIDISSYQGKIDGAVVKNSVDFVILRSILRNLTPDTEFEYNYAQCVAHDIPVGVFKFSYALTPEDARNEAYAVINLIKNKKIQCGVWLDLEWVEQRALGENAISAIAEAFISTMAAAGYKSGIYCNLDWYNNVLDTERLNYVYWIARYPKDDNGYLKEEYRPEPGIMWQYSRKGRVPGINALAVDMNVSYVNLIEMFKVETELSLSNTVSAHFLNVRSGSGKNHPIMRTIKKGDKVKITKVENEWLFIGDGWVSSKYIDSTLGVITAHSLKIRQLPNTSAASAVLGYYKKDERVALLAEENGWYLTPRGWVSGKYVKGA